METKTPAGPRPVAKDDARAPTMPTRSPLLAIPVLLLAGCAVGPDYRAPRPAELGVPERFANAVPPTTAADLPAREVDLTRWWQAFGDPVLVELVERALAANLDVAAAGARFRQARAALGAERGGLWPSLGASAAASRSFDADAIGSGGTVVVGRDRTVYDAGFDAAWELDLFGGTRRAVEAAAADAQASQADLHAVQLAIAAEVALNYVDLRLAEARLGIARGNLASQDETLQIVGWRVQAGLASSLDLEQARQLRARTAATVPALEQGVVAARNRLAVLLGEAPGALDARVADARGVPLAPSPADAIPADVLRRRPDVVAAERSLAAATARIGVRQADLYPALRLSGSFAGTGFSWSQATDAAAANALVGLTAPLFQGGRLRAAVEGQRAATDAALADYRRTVLTALEDTENALVAVDATARRERELAVAEDAARTAATLARSQYQAGLTDFQALLESERSLLSAEDSRATARADRAASAVQLYKALGGGWESAPPPRTVEGEPRER